MAGIIRVEDVRMKCKRYLGVLLFLIASLGLCSCGSEIETVDVLSDHDASYIPEDIYTNKKAVVEEKGLVYWTYKDGTAILFDSKSEDTNIVIAEKVKGCEVIGINASVFCESDIEEITIPDTVLYIGERAFFSCDKLKIVHWGEGLLEIGKEAFAETAISELKLPEGLEIIGEKAFSNSEIKKLIIPDTVKAIKEAAFYECAKLSNIEIGKGVCRIDRIVFANTPWFEEQTDEFVIVGDGVFIKYNGAASQVIVPEGVKSIANAFRENYRITDIVLPDSLLAVGDGAFEGCGQLDKVIIPESVRYIGCGAFWGQEKVFLPRVEYMHVLAFSFAEAAQIYFHGDEEEWMELAGDDNFKQVYFHNLSVIYNVNIEDMENL